MIPQRSKDVYVNATAMCKAAGRRVVDYMRLDANKEFMTELEGSVRNLTDPLVISTTTGPNELRSTWGHPDMAVNLAQWCSAKFAVAVSQWVREWMTTGKAVIHALDFSNPLTPARLYIEAEEGRRVAIAEVKELTEEVATLTVEKEVPQQQFDLLRAKVDVAGHAGVVLGMPMGVMKPADRGALR